MTLDLRRAQAWEAMHLGPLWVRREALAADASAGAVPGEVDAPAAAAGDSAAVVAHYVHAPAAGVASARAPSGDEPVWEALEQEVRTCTACGLCRSRTQTVFGVGYRRAHWMLIGEAPGAEEDARGEPFVGQAGRLLDNMLAAVGMSRTGNDERTVFIANVLKCRPPGNRNPEPSEVASCEPFLRRQIALVQPRLIVVMGRFAAQSVLGTDASIASLRGRAHTLRAGDATVPVVVTYHPAYLLRNLADKAKAWQDLCFARDVYARAAG